MDLFKQNSESTILNLSHQAMDLYTESLYISLWVCFKLIPKIMLELMSWISP